MRRPFRDCAARMAASLLVVAATLATSRRALADVTKAQCIESDTNAQNERRAQHLRAARELLQTCSKPACPKLVRDDCTQRLNDLDSVTPTVVFAAKDAGGDDVVAVRVSMDGTPLASELAGAALQVDPGPHVFKFATDGASDVERKIVIHEGEKDRQERVVFSDLNASKGHGAGVAGAAGGARVEPSSSSGAWGGQKSAAVVIGGAGVAGIIVGSVLGALSFSAWSSSKSECSSTSCPNRTKALSDHDSATTDALVSDVGFIAGGALLAGGLVLYLTAPSSASTTSGGLRIVPSVGREGTGLRLEGRF